MMGYGCALLVLLFAGLIACWAKFGMPVLKRVVPVDVHDVPSFAGYQLGDNHVAEKTVSVITGKAKNYLTWRPALNTTAGVKAQIIVVGDSYADDIDMNFVCWPSQLAIEFGVSMLNMARGGSESKHVRAQLAHASDFLRTSGILEEPIVQTAHHTLLIIHTGGNDVLHALGNLRLLLSLVADVWRFRVASWGWISKPAQFLFAEELGAGIARQMDALLAYAAEQGYMYMLVSQLPISPAIPLARFLIYLVSGGGSAFVTEVLQCFSRTVQQKLATTLLASAVKYSIRLELFEEGEHLENLAAAAGAADYGLWELLGRLGASVWRFWGLSNRAHFWLDGHHPGLEAQTELAKKAAPIARSFGIL